MDIDAILQRVERIFLVEETSWGTYQAAWTRQNRGLLVFLLDQSGSMGAKVQVAGQSYQKAEAAAAALNSLIVSVVNNAPFDPQTGKRKDYCDILILGYGDQVKSLLNTSFAPVSVADLAANPRGQQVVQVERYDSLQGKVVATPERRPYWITAYAYSQKTETAQALRRTHEGISNWLRAERRRNLSFPPIVINITDGMHNGEGDPILEAQRVRQLSTEDGSVLIFNCHITALDVASLTLPSNLREIAAHVSPQERECAELLFQMSSPIPATMRTQARNIFGSDLAAGARGFIYNADAKDLINFLNWGTRQTQI